MDLLDLFPIDSFRKKTEFLEGCRERVRGADHKDDFNYFRFFGENDGGFRLLFMIEEAPGKIALNDYDVAFSLYGLHTSNLHVRLLDFTFTRRLDNFYTLYVSGSAGGERYLSGDKPKLFGIAETSNEAYKRLHKRLGKKADRWYQIANRDSRPCIRVPLIDFVPEQIRKKGREFLESSVS